MPIYRDPLCGNPGASLMCRAGFRVPGPPRSGRELSEGISHLEFIFLEVLGMAYNVPSVTEAGQGLCSSLKYEGS